MAKFLDEIGLSYFYGKLKSKFSNYVYVGTNPPADLPVNAIWINPSEEGDGSWADISDMVKSVNGKAPDADGNVNVANMTGASDSATGKAGLVPIPTAGKQDMALCGDATFKVLPIVGGGTGATTASDACANIGALPTSGGNITGSLSIGGYVVVPCYSNAAAHNAIFRGKYLGNHVADEQWAAIKAGTFDDLYIGDYWTIGGVDYVIAAFNYYLNCGDTACTANHVTIVPRKNLYNHVMNDTDVATGAYVGSKMYASGLNSAKTTIASAFGSAHILSIRQHFQNSVTGNYENGGAWYDASVFLMSEINVYGGNVWKNIVAGTNWPNNYQIDNSQYPVFAFDKTMIHTRQYYWLRNVAYSGYFCFVYYTGHCSNASASASLGVRPAFNIYQS